MLFIASVLTNLRSRSQQLQQPVLKYRTARPRTKSMRTTCSTVITRSNIVSLNNSCNTRQQNSCNTRHQSSCNTRQQSCNNTCQQSSCNTRQQSSCNVPQLSHLSQLSHQWPVLAIASASTLAHVLTLATVLTLDRTCASIAPVPVIAPVPALFPSKWFHTR